MIETCEENIEIEHLDNDIATVSQKAETDIMFEETEVKHLANQPQPISTQIIMNF